MSSFMTSLEPDHEKYVQRAWQDALSQLAQKHGQILLPGNIIEAIGDQGLQLIAERYCDLVHATVSIYKVPDIDIYQLVPNTIETSISSPPQHMNGNDSGTAAITATSEPERITVPRPSNCWILYRVHRHKQLKAADPNISNEEVSRIAGEEWRDGTKAFKDVWRVKAKELKLQHAQTHPDYKYTPRKPGQKKRRQRKIAARAVQSAANAPVSDEIPAEVFDYDLSQAPANYLDIEKSADGSSVQYALFPGHHDVSCLKSMADRHNAQNGLEHSTTLPSVETSPLEIASFDHHALSNEMLMGMVRDSNDVIDLNKNITLSQIRYADQPIPSFQPNPSAEAGLMQPLQQDLGLNYGVQYSDRISAQAAPANSAGNEDLLTEEEIAALTNTAPFDPSVDSDFDHFFNFLNDN